MNRNRQRVVIQTCRFNDGVKLSNKMKDYIWSTEISHANNTETMQDYINNHLHESLTYLFQDGSYAEAINENTNERWGIHASGNGDFNNHRVRFELLS